MKRLFFAAAIVTTLVAIAWTGVGQAGAESGKAVSAAAVSLQPKDFSGLLGMAGFSDTMLNNHFKLYQGYVKNANVVLEKLNALLADKNDRTPEYAELKRRLGWEFNGMMLHEYYFENLGGKEPPDLNGALYKSIAGNFGSFDNWKQDFVSTGMMRGIGWVVLCWEPRTGKLVNVWVNEHDAGHIVGAKPLLVMDVFEHAYMLDYQLDKGKYIEAFFKNVNWKSVAECFQK